MSAIDTIQQVASMLPEDKQQRFMILCQRFQNVPEDDEFLLLLEAICLNTLLWKEVPAEISNILTKATPISSNHQQLQTMIENSVQNSIPSHEDMKHTCSKLEESILLLKRQSTPTLQVQMPLKRIQYITLGILIGCALPYLLAAIL